jgi:aminocarboxymuconate-semialdehyde decarboxylase
MEESDMLFTCANPSCTDPRHHGAGRAAARAAGAKLVRPAKKAAPRGKTRTLRIDVHCHYLNAEVQEKVAPYNPGQYDALVKFANALTRETNLKQGRDRAAKLTDIKTRLKEMDRMGVDIQAVSPAPNQTNYWAEPGLGAELARMVNERIAGIVAETPDRFVGLGTVPLQNAELAVAELEHCVRKLGLRGVEINPNVNGMELSDPRLGLDKFFAKVEEFGVVIFMHPSGFSQGERLTDHYFNNVIGNPLETTVATSHLIFDGVMDRHPKLKIILPHAGGYLAHYWARMDHAHRARADCRTVIKRKPTSYLKKFYFDTITFDTQMLRQLIDKFGADHVLLGTDYPYDMGEEDPVGLIGSVPRLSAADRDLIMGGNAVKLLKIRR